MCGTQVRLIHLVLNQLICDPCRIQQPTYIRFLDLLSHYLISSNAPVTESMMKPRTVISLGMSGWV